MVHLKRITAILGIIGTFSLIVPATALNLSKLSNKDAAAGVKQTLKVGANYAVEKLGITDGFWGSEKYRIPLPDSLQDAEKLMTKIGMGDKFTELHHTMNRAAEQAVATAKPVLIDSVNRMTLLDAKAILTGGDDSVTRYFRQNSAEQLKEKFLPIIHQHTERLGVSRQYQKIAEKAAQLGLIDENSAKLDEYINQHATDALFSMVAEKEKALRQNPAEAATGLLKKIFGAK